MTRESAEERRETGTLYRFQAMQLYASGFACVGLGTARAALDAFIALAKGKSQGVGAEIVCAIIMRCSISQDIAMPH